MAPSWPSARPSSKVTDRRDDTGDFLQYSKFDPTIFTGLLPRMMLLWRNAFPRSPKEFESERARGDAFTWRVRCVILIILCITVTQYSIYYMEYARAFILPISICICRCSNVILPWIEEMVSTSLSFQPRGSRWRHGRRPRLTPVVSRRKSERRHTAPTGTDGAPS